ANKTKTRIMPPKRKSLRFIGKVLITLNGIAVLLLLLSYLAPFVKPQVFWPFAFMGIAYPVFLFFNVIFVFIWLFRKPSLSLISLFAILIGWTRSEEHTSELQSRENLVCRLLR